MSILTPFFNLFKKVENEPWGIEQFNDNMDIIDAEMHKLGRTSVPVNVLYIPGAEPAITPELLTPGNLMEFLIPRLANVSSGEEEEAHEDEGEMDDEAAADAAVEEAEPETEEAAE